MTAILMSLSNSLLESKSKESSLSRRCLRLPQNVTLNKRRFLGSIVLLGPELWAEKMCRVKGWGGRRWCKKSPDYAT